MTKFLNTLPTVETRKKWKSKKKKIFEKIRKKRKKIYPFATPIFLAKMAIKAKNGVFGLHTRKFDPNLRVSLGFWPKRHFWPPKVRVFCNASGSIFRQKTQKSEKTPDTLYQKSPFLLKMTFWPKAKKGLTGSENLAQNDQKWPNWPK